MKVKTNLESGRGLGDAVADLAHLTGLDRVAQLYERVTGKSCGCDERRQALNQIVPLGKPEA
jgi:hypothetical protein